MRICVYTICWNEEQMLPYFLRHYEKFVDKIVVYDNGSSDATKEILARHPLCEVRDLTAQSLNEDSLLWAKSESWISDVAEASGGIDWIIACDVDEFLFHREPRQYLKSCLQRGISLPSTRGFEMVSEDFPTSPSELTKICQRGIPRPLYSKHVVFSPQKIDRINYGPGCHQASPTGDVVSDGQGEFALLHYGSIGRARMLQRRQLLRARNSAENLRRGFGSHYESADEEFCRKFDSYLMMAEPCLFLGWGSVTIGDLIRWGKRGLRRLAGLNAVRPSL
jgi:hypothetical protein